ncbi:MAG: pyridoxal phosphate-dependent aminotransferase, partial [Planctomycetes bacterium]|nr:pyridoxal phosphate-dependent aminotransferase [Planctomycetota bacterium]
MKENVSHGIMELPRVGSRIIDGEIEKLCNSGHEVLPLRGYPYRSLPEHILEMVKSALKKIEHSPSQGLWELRESISSRLTEELKITVNPSEIIVTNGAMDALNIVFNVLLDVDDEVIIFSPCFFFEGIIRMAGGKIKYIKLDENDKYALDINKLESSITPKVKAILVTTPNNPTGHVATREELETISEIAKRFNIWVISDESYDRFIYDGYKHHSILSIQGARERTVLVRSFTKSFCMADWRVGYIVCPLEIVESCIKVLEWRILYNNFLSQKVAAIVLQNSEDWISDTIKGFHINRDLMFNGIKSIEQIHAVKPMGGPFFFVNIEKLSIPCEIFSRVLLYEYGIPTTPGCWHQECNHFRIAFGGEKENIYKAVERIKKAVK